MSHFDRDHVSGLVRLLKRSTVDALLLPYLPMWQRLSLAFSEGIDTQQALFGFFVNPVEYISRMGTNLEKIIFVPGGSSEPPGEPRIFDGPSPTGDSPWNLDADLGEPRGSDQQEDASIFSRTSKIGVEWLRPGGTLNVNRLWEFVPYNDASLSPEAGKRFQTLIARHRSHLLSAKTDRSRARALADIKNAYDRAFGSSGLRRNLISLFLYSGALRPEPARLFFLQSDRAITLSDRTGTLYTGDGYLNSSKRLLSVTEFLGKRRLRNLGCVQVMHHGSRSNWHEGVAAKLNPSLSVFSSDPDNRALRHPHAEVLRDFWPHVPIQLHKGQDIAFGVAL